MFSEEVDGIHFVEAAVYDRTDKLLLYLDRMNMKPTSKKLVLRRPG
jgi:hypothetical protein